MKQLFILLVILLISASASMAQISVNTDGSTPDPSAMLDVKSATLGFLPPRIALVSIDSAAPVAVPVGLGLLVYNTATSGIAPNNVVPGYYCWSGTQWMPVSSPRGTSTGDMLYWNGIQYVTVPVGLPGQYLRVTAAGMPAWSGGTYATLSTVPAYSITSISAISGGNITSDGGAPVTARGVCWSMNPNPTIADSKTSDGSGSGMFTSYLTGLTSNSSYYIRAYAINSTGVTYGNELMFSNLCSISAPLVGVHEPSPSQIIWKWNPVPGADGYKWGITNNYLDATDMGVNRTKTEIGLNCNTAYSRFVWAYGACGNSVSTQLDQTTMSCYGLPVLSTTPVTNIAQTTAVSGGNILDDGGSPVLFRGVCWATSPNPTVSNGYTTDGSGIGEFQSNLSGLSANTLYYFRAYAINSNGTGYGLEYTFVTLTTITTTPATLITLTTAASGGNITSDGGNPILSRGVCWSISAIPTISDSKTLDSSGIGSFTSSLTGLTPNTLYYVRTYATNSTGTDYGNEITFSTLLNPALATVTTDEITNVLSTTASGGGNVLSDGGAAVTFRGICWGASPNPTIADSHTTNGGGPGVFTSSLTGLNPGTQYHVRGYAINSAGTAYGNEVVFTPHYVIGENVGGGVVFYVDATGVNGLISSTTDQTTGASWGCDGSIMGTSVAVGAGQTNTTAIVTGCLQAGIAARICDDLVLNGYSDWFLPSREEIYLMYPKRELIGNFSGGYYWTSSETGSITAQSFAFSQGYGYDNHAKWAAFAVRAIRAFWSQVVLPIVSTTAITDITQIAVTGGGSVISDGGAEVTARGVCWSTSFYPVITDNHTSDGAGIGAFTSTIQGLTPSTLYHVRSYAVNSAGTAYGDDVSFTTSPPLVVTTDAVTFITSSSAKTGGTVSPPGGAAVTARGVCWSNNPNPTIADSLTSDGTGTGAFVTTLTGLTPDTTYYIRAYAVNSSGTTYGEELQFTTLLNPGLAIVTTTVPVTLTPYTASTGGNVLSDGGSLVVYRGVCWGTSPNPDITGSHTVDGNGTGEFASTLTGLIPDSIYYVRAFATNSLGTAYGNEIVYNNGYSIGANYGGGIVFYIDPSGQYGLISATNNLSAPVPWSYFDFPVGGTSTAIGTGQANTTAIVGSFGSVAEAAYLCSELVLNGYDDWFLPSKDELNQMYLHQSEIGTFPTNYSYWSSSEDGFSNAWRQLFNNGSQVAGNKHDQRNVRPVRMFYTTIILPTVTTTAVTGITQTTALSGGNVTHNGNDTVSARGVCWSTIQNPTLTDNHTTDSAGMGSYSSVISGLTANTTYFLRSYATNSLGTGYGNELSFNTSASLAVTTDTIRLIATTSASGGGFITPPLGAEVTARGVCWSTMQNPTLSDNHTTDGTGPGGFHSTLVDLFPNTVYYVKAYATNIYGTVYGNEMMFTTLLDPIMPTVTTAPVTNTSLSSAVGGGNVLSDGGAPVSARGICWSTIPNPTTANYFTSDGGGPGSYTSDLTSLSMDTTYYIRAYATNDVGTAYGEEIVFTNTFYIGASYGGGVIFYLDSTGHHGLISGPVNLASNTTWGCECTGIGTSPAMGTGQSNTTAIVNGCAEPGTAARICDDLVLNGYNDWFLPSQEELHQLYLHRLLIGGYENEYYWTSTEQSGCTAWHQYFADGNHYTNGKYNTHYVVAVRAF